MAAGSITYMDDSLYEAAASGRIKKFKGIALESLQTPNRNNVLHVNLATKGCIKFTEEMLNQCPSLLLQVNAQGRTPLHIAARHGDSDIVKFLIRFRADQGDLEQQETALEAVRRMLRMTDLNSDTALHVAARYCHVGVVQELVEFEDPYYSYPVNKNQETPVYVAAMARNGDVVGKILNKLKSTAHGGPKRRTSLHAAAMAKYDRNANTSIKSATRRILEEVGGNLAKETDENGHTPLHYAAHLGHFGVVEELLKWDKSAAYIADSKSQMTPLLMAARQGYVDIVIKILSFCPDCCEIVDKNGWNFLHFLAFSGKLNTGFEDDPVGKFPLKYFMTQHGFVQDLFYAADESGITPKQVHRACCLPEYFDINLHRDEKEQIMKLVEDIANEQVAERRVNPRLIKEKETENMDKAAKETDDNEVNQSHLVVATLVATVTFAAAVTVPGGYKSEKGPDQGTPFLLQDAAFIAFVVSDALAFFCSVVAIVTHFGMLFEVGKDLDIKTAAAYIVCSLWALMVAFYTGIFAVLRPSRGIAIFSLCLGIFFHLVIFRITLPILGYCFERTKDALILLSYILFHPLVAFSFFTAGMRRRLGGS